MSWLGSQSRRRLHAMGIELWRPRAVRLPQAAGHEPRFRLAAGSGDWLLVCPGGVPEPQRVLMDDIMASIGPARCRFGEWADSIDAGVSADEWQARGIEHALIFAEAERRPGRGRIDDARVIEAPALSELAVSGRARKALWQQLLPRLSR